VARDTGWIDELTRETVIVHCQHDGPSFKGVLAAVHSDALVLSSALLLEPEAQTLMDGQTVIPRENIAYLQVISA
jgi:hypothetical protein